MNQFPFDGVNSYVNQIRNINLIKNHLKNQLYDYFNNIRYQIIKEDYMQNRGYPYTRSLLRVIFAIYECLENENYYHNLDMDSITIRIELTNLLEKEDVQLTQEWKDDISLDLQDLLILDTYKDRGFCHTEFYKDRFWNGCASSESYYLKLEIINTTTFS